MSYFDRVAIQVADSPASDAFGRLRVSDPVTLFDSTLQYTTGALLWEDVTNGGSATHNPNTSSVTISTGGGTSGNYHYRQSREYIRYQPGKSQLVIMTGVLGAKKANVRQRVGYFDAQNGCFFEQDETNLKVIVRTYAGGSPDDTAATNQSAWNLDSMDGNGPSGIDLDMSKTQIFVIDLQWLGVGRVRFGFEVNGTLVYCHEVLHANQFDVPYMTTANLPVRWEIENTGAATGATTMLQVCTAVISEGGFEDDRGYNFTANNGITAIGVTTRRAILSIRPRTTLNSITWRGRIIPLTVETFTKTNDALVEIVYNPTFSGTPTWTAVDSTNSGVEYSVHGDAAAGAISNGIVIQSFYASGPSSQNRSAASTDIKSKLPLVLDSSGANPRALSIVVTSFTSTSNNTAAMSWKEIR